MRGNEFLDKMGLIKPDYVEEADIKPAKNKFSWIKLGTAAACFILIVFIGTKFLPTNTTIQDGSLQNTASNDEPAEKSVAINPNLPKLTISENKAGGMGYEGYMAYDISEIVNANPWNEAVELSALPVYKRAVDVDISNYFLVTGTNWDKMREFILDIAERLGLDKNKITVTNNFENDEYQWKLIKEHAKKEGKPVPEGQLASSALVVSSNGIKIEVDQFMTATISFEPALSMPDSFNFGFYASYKDNVAAADYLKTKYKNLIGYENPQINIDGGYYNIDADQSYSIEFYNKGKDYTENIINYNFNRTIFYHNEDSTLDLLRIFQPDLSKKLGDYPIITAAQARKLLINGNYITSVPYKMPGEKYIKKVELVYRTGEMEECYMPYYRFYVELTEEKREHGLKDYGAYYVPAVEGSYLTNMPVWDGGFN